MDGRTFEELTPAEQEPFRNAAYGGTLTPGQMWHRVTVEGDPSINSTLFAHMEAQGRAFREAQRIVKTASPEASAEAVATAPEGGISLAQIAYEAYGRAGPNPWKTFDGRPMPRWEDLQGDAGELTKARWAAGVAQAISAHENRTKVEPRGRAIGHSNVGA